MRHSPWSYRLKNSGNGYIIREHSEPNAEEGHNICDVFMTNDSKIAESRARLISAAPDLLEACKALQMEAAARNCGLRIADEAIAKAEGTPAPNREA